jgi:hypothetical protein
VLKGEAGSVREECQVLGSVVEEDRVIVKYRAAKDPEREMRAAKSCRCERLGKLQANREAQRESYSDHFPSRSIESQLSAATGPIMRLVLNRSVILIFQ